MKEQDLKEKWVAASEFRLWRDGANKFREIFPNRESLKEFYLDFAHVSWPESYGQSPYSDSFGIAYDINYGLSVSGRAWMEKNRGENSTENRIACLALFGIEIERGQA